MKPLYSLFPILYVSASSGQLTAGDIDDNLNFEQYLSYNVETLQNEGSKRVLPRPYLKDRVPLQISDVNGDPFSCAQVDVGGKTLYTGSDGKLNLFPLLDSLGVGPWELQYKPPNGRCPIECIMTTVGEPSDSKSSVELRIPIESTPPPALDMALLLDTSSTMCEQIDFFRTNMDRILSQSVTDNIDVRLALIAYKSLGDATYDVSLSDFVDTTSFSEKLLRESCSGSGPKKLVHGALEVAARDLKWRNGNVARMALLVGEFSNSPTLSYELNQAFHAALDLRSLGVRVYGISTSNITQYEYLFRLLSVVTNARYMWIDDEMSVSLQETPKVQCYQITELENLLTRVIQSELTGRRIEADPSTILRQVGQQSAGVCLYDMNAKVEIPSQYVDPDNSEVLPVEKSVTVTNASNVDDSVESGSARSSVFGWLLACLVMSMTVK